MNVYTDLLKELADKQKILLCWMCQWERVLRQRNFGDSFGAGIGTTNLQHAKAAYYPWLGNFGIIGY